MNGWNDIIVCNIYVLCAHMHDKIAAESKSFSTDRTLIVALVAV